MKVAVKWLKSPRHVYGIPRAPGSWSALDLSFALKVRESDPKFFESEELDNYLSEKEKPVEVKDTMVKKTRTRPVKK